MGTVVLAGATSGSTTLTPTDAVTATITLPSVTGALAILGANTFTGTQTVPTLVESTGAAWTAYVPALTANAGTWGGLTVTTARYRLLGKTLFIQLYGFALVGSGSPTEFQLTLPSGTFASGAVLPCITFSNNGYYEAGIVTIAAAGTLFKFSRLTGAAYVGSCMVSGNFVIELA